MNIYSAINYLILLFQTKHSGFNLRVLQYVNNMNQIQNKIVSMYNFFQRKQREPLVFPFIFPKSSILCFFLNIDNFCISYIVKISLKLLFSFKDIF